MSINRSLRGGGDYSALTSLNRTGDRLPQEMSLKPETAAALVTINRQFYQRLAKEFSATRLRLQPGVQRILASIPNQARILDIGCGNGTLALYLVDRGFNGSYIGLDFSLELLEEARACAFPYSAFAFQPGDLSQIGWEKGLGHSKGFPPFDYVLAFAVLHHLPGSELRRQVVSTVRSLLAPSAQFIHSEWQFLNSSRLRLRLQPWDSAGLSADDVEAGDYLLDWRRGGFSLRYVHYFDTAELESLAAQTGFNIRQTFLADGENHRLGLYQVWEVADGN